MARLSEASRAVMETAYASASVRDRFFSLIGPDPLLPHGCRLWVGAISGQGHGRFWLGRSPTTGGDVVVIAHRWAYALATTLTAMLNAPVIRHTCDTPLCQNPDHLVIGESWENTVEAFARRELIGNPLRDTRGARQRAEALRAAARSRSDLLPASRDGLPEVDRYQEPLEGL